METQEEIKRVEVWATASYPLVQDSAWHEREKQINETNKANKQTNGGGTNRQGEANKGKETSEQINKDKQADR